MSLREFSAKIHKAFLSRVPVDYGGDDRSGVTNACTIHRQHLIGAAEFAMRKQYLEKMQADLINELYDSYSHTVNDLMREISAHLAADKRRGISVCARLFLQCSGDESRYHIWLRLVLLMMVYQRIETLPGRFDGRLVYEDEK